MDYGKYKFELEKKAREARKKQHTADVKEVKMRYKIENTIIKCVSIKPTLSQGWR